MQAIQESFGHALLSTWATCLLLIPLMTYMMTTILFRRASQRLIRQASAPEVPYCIPIIAHAFSLAWSPGRFIAKILYFFHPLLLGVSQTDKFAAKLMGPRFHSPSRQAR